MTKPKYRTKQHQQARAHYAQVIRRGEGWCVEPVCLLPTRHIAPGTAWDVCHDPSARIITGPGHAKCNRAEGAKRGNAMRNPPKRRVL